MYIQLFYNKIEETLKKIRGTQYVVHKREVQRTCGEKSSVVTMLEVLPPINDTSVLSLMNKLVELELSYRPVVIYGQSIENNPELEKYGEPEVILKYARIDFDFTKTKVLDSIIIPELHIKDTRNITADTLKSDVPIAFGLHDEIFNKPYILNLSYKVAAVSCKDVISILEL